HSNARRRWPGPLTHGSGRMGASAPSGRPRRALGPTSASFHGLPPARLEAVRLVAGHHGLELAIELPEVRKVGLVPDARAESGQERGAKGRGPGMARPADLRSW